MQTFCCHKQSFHSTKSIEENDIICNELKIIGNIV